ncbi:hypothetical protein PVAND_002241 [Polypedilum vanderplanki]|uniref:Uncharacterized protein n=1 Tax=Polypedilum vanderplanki TaxID=319348 RepID=A0A9J6BRU9_POLVA|nr:hypothetical protein PVAND_002241 [Polypedilum vanderplanki]
MNFKFLTCHESVKQPKSNVANRKSVKKKNSSHKKSSTHRRRIKNTYKSSNLFSKNFYPANYFFQDDYRARLYDTRVGVNDQNGFLITARNPPQIPSQAIMPRKNLPSSMMLLQQQQNYQYYLPMKVGFYYDFFSYNL